MFIWNEEFNNNRCVSWWTVLDFGIRQVYQDSIQQHKPPHSKLLQILD